MTRLEILIEAVSKPKKKHVERIVRIVKQLTKQNGLPYGGHLLLVQGPNQEAFLGLIKAYHLNFSMQECSKRPTHSIRITS